MVRIKWLKEARNDLKEIYNYISTDSKRYARLQVEKIKDTTQLLHTHPQIGKTVIETNDPNIRELIEGNYRIIYRIVNDNTVHILWVHHGARDLILRLKNF